MEVTTLHSDAAADSDRIVDVMDLTALTADCVDRTVARTDGTARADRFLDLHPDQRAANFRRAVLLVNSGTLFTSYMRVLVAVSDVLLYFS